MSRPDRDRTPREGNRPGLAGRVADGTTRLILLAIVAGGLLTIASNLSRLPSAPETDDPPEESDLVAPVDDLLREGFPVVQKTVQGDEAVARNAVVQAFREKIDDAAKRVAEFQARSPVKTAPEASFETAVELARDPDGKWSIHQIEDVRRMIVGVVRAGRMPTIMFWGGYDETGPGEWTTWTMLLPLSEEK